MQTGSTHEHAAPRILVVDDEPAIVDFLELGLGREGFAVEDRKVRFGAPRG